MEKNRDLIKHVEEHQQNKQLSSAELADLFNNYLGDSMFCCVFEHYLQVVEDEEVRNYIEFALSLSRRHVKEIKNIFLAEKIPVPVGFGEQDVRKGSPRLFSDLFMIFYITQMASAALLTYGSAFGNSTRHDIMSYFRNCLNDSAETFERGCHLLLSKGMDISPPNIPYAKKVDFVEKKSFISIFTGRDRPLTAIEIKQLHLNINMNLLGKALMLGFSQIASSDKLRNYFSDGAKLSSYLIKSFSDHLINQDLPAPKLLDAHISDSTSSPFSDKLLLYHTSLAGNLAIQNFGSALSQMLRHDLSAEFIKLITLVGKYSNDGLNMMIEHGWLEEPFSAADRDVLSKTSSSN
ncbi:DUF3231 family protein [Bacillus sp. S/N-304-OC-R1]|uniref:DUF3231 family protein n=1 Tax=Bacillus sp. S/N-304-OC-R1 TaxID=2758034 RepID=UPI001C8D4393|nr:DUF3231 family protein [Bacillus sp. S/N-304-OC-R1]MBY0121642.1 DUF3231 family protein [Bacillus sp. S/N-304-OC-R1]